ncbi:MAG: hypothetical protein UY96_C0019G0016 [Parcubacteria group bacterium GW2011_GWB1_56_8]|nr:MAG: hypothetical protein UY96_C0019G0016 [Parcubacteria group bacterium GW2011_GWB1_56_8]
MIGFRVVPHSILPGVQIVEVLVDGEVGGVVYPAGEKAIRIVSAHIAETATDEGFDGEVVEDDGTKSWQPDCEAQASLKKVEGAMSDPWADSHARTGPDLFDGAARAG